jgi:hypothetical protein
MHTTTATPTATALATDPADVTGTADVAAVLARLTQVTDHLAATIHTHTSGGNDSGGGGEGGGVVRVGMPHEEPRAHQPANAITHRPRDWQPRPPRGPRAPRNPFVRHRSNFGSDQLIGPTTSRLVDN